MSEETKKTGRLTEASAREIYRIAKSGKQNSREIASTYGVNESTVRRIRDRAIWKGIHKPGRPKKSS